MEVVQDLRTWSRSLVPDVAWATFFEINRDALTTPVSLQLYIDLTPSFFAVVSRGTVRPRLHSALSCSVGCNRGHCPPSI